MNIFEHEDYKEILKLIVRSRGKAQRGLFRKIAEHLGVHATLVSQVISGSKDFSEEQMLSVCDFLGVSKMESQYLLCLLQIERAGSKKLKDHYTENKEELRRKALQVSERIQKDRKLSEHEKAIFYSSWIYSAIQVYSTLEKEVRFEDICKRFTLSPAKAREILNFLTESQLVKEKDGRFLPGTTSTHLESKSPFIAKHHTNWRLKAIQASENLTDQELLYSANMSISKKDFVLLREEMVQVIQKFLKVVKDSPAEEIAQFNLDLFWIK